MARSGLEPKKKLDFRTEEPTPGNAQPSLTCPSSPVLSLTNTMFAAGEGHIGEISDRKKELGRGTRYSKTYVDGTARFITAVNSGMEITVRIDDVATLAGNADVRRLFRFLLTKINDQSVRNGELVREVASWSLQEMVDRKMYSSLDTARRGFYVARDALTSVKVRGVIRRRRKTFVSVDDLQVLFVGGRVENSQCKMFLNPNIAWAFVIQYYTILPGMFFSLSVDAQDLLFLIFDQARQNGVLDKDGTGIDVNVGHRAIQHALFLPSEKTQHPKQLIKDPIDRAVCEIEEAYRKQYENDDLTLTPVYDPMHPEVADYAKVSIATYLRGYVKVHIGGDLASPLVAVLTKKSALIERARRKREKLADKAKELALAKKMAQRAPDSDGRGEATGT